MLYYYTKAVESPPQVFTDPPSFGIEGIAIMPSVFFVECLGALSVLLPLLIALYRITHAGVPYPPGPPGEFLLGHLRVIPQEKTAQTYARWGKEYSLSIESVTP